MLKEIIAIQRAIGILHVLKVKLNYFNPYAALGTFLVFNPYAALGTFLVFCSLISLTILAVLMQMV